MQHIKLHNTHKRTTQQKNEQCKQCKTIPPNTNNVQHKNNSREMPEHRIVKYITTKSTVATYSLPKQQRHCIIVTQAVENAQHSKQYKTVNKYTKRQNSEIPT